jgi:hypothetical protein
VFFKNWDVWRLNPQNFRIVDIPVKFGNTGLPNPAAIKPILPDERLLFQLLKNTFSGCDDTKPNKTCIALIQHLYKHHHFRQGNTVLIDFTAI